MFSNNTIETKENGLGERLKLYIDLQFLKD